MQALATLAMALQLLLSPCSAEKVQIFILAGQSNTVGHGSLEHLDFLIQEDTNSEYAKELWNGTAYDTRSDVFVRNLNTFGNLSLGSTPGFAANPTKFGPEVMFGRTVGDASSAPVLLIKTAWGGKSLAVDFRPPSSGEGNYPDVLPSQFGLFEYGFFYNEMIANVQDTITNLRDYGGFDDYELAGLVWFQGWNDLIDRNKVNEYGFNLKNFIQDVRLDLGTPDLPIVIGELGMHGINPSGSGTDRVLLMREAQQSVAALPEFRETVSFCRTAPYAVVDETKRYNGIHHYYGRADTYFHIGQALGRSMLELLSRVKENSSTGEATPTGAPSMAPTASPITAPTVSPITAPIVQSTNFPSRMPVAAGCAAFDGCYLAGLSNNRVTELKLLSLSRNNNYNGDFDYSIRCNVASGGKVDRLVFEWTNTNNRVKQRTERVVPYWMGGDNAGSGWIGPVNYLSSCGSKSVTVVGQLDGNECFRKTLHLQQNSC